MLAVASDDISEFKNDEVIEIRISKQDISDANMAIRDRNFYGYKSYSANSDPVCIIKHLGVVNFMNPEDISLFFKVSKPQAIYESVMINKIKSRQLLNDKNHSTLTLLKV